MPKMKDLTGLKLNKLTVIKRVEKPVHLKSKDIFWLCKCDCGNERILPAGKLTHGQKSCGCLKTGKKKIHGLSHTRFYHIFANLLQRCINKKHVAYSRYGGRDIKCLWKDFVEFKRDMYESYAKHCEKFGEKQTSIDRIDNNGNYCKENCKWATHKEQSNNTRANLKNKFIELQGKKYNLKELSDKFNISVNQINKRLNNGETPEEISKNHRAINIFTKQKKQIYLEFYNPEVLTTRERKLLELRFVYNFTLEKTSKELGITRERIRQIEYKSLEKLLNF